MVMEHELYWLCRHCSYVRGRSSEQIQEVWAFQRIDSEKKNPAALPWCELMTKSIHIRIYIEMEEISISFLALLGKTCVLSANSLHGREMWLAWAALSNKISLERLPCGK